VESPDVHLKKFRKELHSGIAALVLLSLLSRNGQEMYGYEIAKALGSRAGGQSFLKQGAIYPVLRSLHASGLLSSRVEVSVSGPPRRYFTISPDGQAALKDWLAAWRDVRGFVDGLTAPAAAGITIGDTGHDD
jgi:PadR family transcriptional regulator PadR